MSAADHLNVEQAVLDALGLTREELAEQGLRAFFERAYERGFDITVSTKRALTTPGRLTVTMSDAAQPVPRT